MTKRNLMLLGGGLLLAGGLGYLGWRRFILGFPLNVTRRKVTRAIADENGWVLVAPSTLALQARVSVEDYSLARTIGSEFASGTFTEKLAIGSVVRNEARRRGVSLLRLTTDTSRFGNKGLYGTQEHGRYVATTRDPSEEDVYVAQGILRGAFHDPTGGAVNFFNPGAQSRLHASNPGLYDTPEAFIANRAREGKVAIAVPGTDHRNLLFFRPRA